MEGSVPPSRQTSRRLGSNKKNRNAPRASLACVKCRERKIKCDVQGLDGRGRCTPCRTACTECVVKHDDDRKWRASKNYIVTLEDRIRSLEGVIKNGLPIGKGTPWAGDMHPDIPGLLSHKGTNDEALQVDPVTILPAHTRRWSQTSYDEPLVDTVPTIPQPSTKLQVVGATIPLQVSDESTEHSDLIRSSSSQTSSPSHNNTLPLSLPSWMNRQQGELAATRLTVKKPMVKSCIRNDDNHKTISYPSPLSVSTEPFIRPESPSYEDDRQVKEKVRLRCFGPTCPLHVLLRPNPPGTSSSSSEVDPCMPSLDSAQFQGELLNIFWDFQPLSASIVHKDMFMEHSFHGTANEYYSDFLLNCILACAVRLSTRVAIRRLSALYIKRAKSELVNAMEQTTIATLQGFCLLSDFEMSSGRDQTGWLYAGIACRLSFDLGIHQDCSDLVRTGHISELEASIRQQVFFSCLVNERLWCIYLGRPSLIKTSDFSTPRPRITDLKFQTQTQAAWVDLSFMSSEISEIFNSPSLVDEQTIRRLIDIDSRLHSWFESLPQALKAANGSDTDLHPHVYALHMQFSGIQVLIHRTSIMTRRKFSPAAFSEQEISSLRGQTLQETRLDYHDNAVRIARLLAAFQERVGLERVPPVMLDNLYMATIALISYVSREGQASELYELDVSWMVLLLDALEALQVHYPVAVRMRLTLSDVLRRSWLANSADAPLFHKLSSKAPPRVTELGSGQSSALQFTRNKPPIFDTADLWIIPYNEIGIGYPQYLDYAGQQNYDNMELDPGSMIDTSTYAVNGMDLLEM